MTRNHSSLIALVVVLPIILIALMGCSPSAQTSSTAVPTTPATDVPTATAVQDAVVPTAAATIAQSTIVPTQENVPSTATTIQAGTCTRLNLNDVSQDDLLNTIPNFPDRMVREFFEYRPYSSIQQFRREIGKYVDDAQVAEWEQYVYVPIDVNNSDAESLKQIPGVDDTIAASLIAARPYASNDAFLTELVKSITAQQAVDVFCYLSTSA